VIPDRMMSLPDAARMLRLPWAAVWNLYLAGHLQGEKRNGRYYVRIGSVERFRKVRAEVTRATGDVVKPARRVIPPEVDALHRVAAVYEVRPLRPLAFDLRGT